MTSCTSCGQPTADEQGICSDCRAATTTLPPRPGEPPGLGSLPISLKEGRVATLAVKRTRNGELLLLLSTRGRPRGRSESFPLSDVGWSDAWHAFRAADPAAAASYARDLRGDAQRAVAQATSRALRAAAGRAWRVHCDGRRGLLAVVDGGLRLDLDGVVSDFSWAARPTVRFPTPYAVALAQFGTETVLEFTSAGDQRRFESTLQALRPQAEAAGAHLEIRPDVDGSATAQVRVPMTTLTTSPDQRPFVDLGLVTASVAVSQDDFSDFVSSLQSIVGLNLTGVEGALDRALELAKDRLSAAAVHLGADAVVGVAFSLAAVEYRADKAQLVIASGTAIGTSTGGDPGPGPL